MSAAVIQALADIRHAAEGDPRMRARLCQLWPVLGSPEPDNLADLENRAAAEGMKSRKYCRPGPVDISLDVAAVVAIALDRLAAAGDYAAIQTAFETAWGTDWERACLTSVPMGYPEYLPDHDKIAALDTRLHLGYGFTQQLESSLNLVDFRRIATTEVEHVPAIIAAGVIAAGVERAFRALPLDPDELRRLQSLHQSPRGGLADLVLTVQSVGGDKIIPGDIPDAELTQTWVALGMPGFDVTRTDTPSDAGEENTLRNWMHAATTANAEHVAYVIAAEAARRMAQVYEKTYYLPSGPRRITDIVEDLRGNGFRPTRRSSMHAHAAVFMHAAENPGIADSLLAFCGLPGAPCKYTQVDKFHATFTSADGNKAYLQDGRVHRDDCMPAVLMASGINRYAIEGVDTTGTVAELDAWASSVPLRDAHIADRHKTKPQAQIVAYAHHKVPDDAMAAVLLVSALHDTPFYRMLQLEAETHSLLTAMFAARPGVAEMVSELDPAFAVVLGAAEIEPALPRKPARQLHMGGR